MADHFKILPLQHLLAILKANGFTFGIDTVVQLNTYWQGLIEAKEVNRETVKYQLAALVCKSEEEQELFYELFDHYLVEAEPIDFKLEEVIDLRKKPIDVNPLPPPPPPPRPKEPSSPDEASLSFSSGPILPVLSFPENPLRVWNVASTSQAMVPLQEKVWMNTQTWDIKKSIWSTIRAGGIPTVAYRQKKRAPRYLALIEQQNPRDHLAAFAASLIQEIENRDLETDYFFFKDTPQRCWKTLANRKEHIYLERLKTEWAGARLLLIGTADCFIDPMTGGPSNVLLNICDHWEETAFLSTDSPVSWGSGEQQLARLFPVVPLITDGLGTLIRQWNASQQFPASYWRLQHPEPVPPKLTLERNQPIDELLIELFRYLGKGGFRWLCATAVYPELYYQLTTHLHDEAIPPGGDFSAWEQNQIWNEALSRLCKLSWFRQGYIPERFRARLKQLLEPADLAIIEKEIRRILEWSSNTVPEGSYAAAERQELFGWLTAQLYSVLWLDDHPENHTAFQERLRKTQAILFRNVRLPGEAFPLLDQKFDLIISDLGSVDGLKGGVNLLEEFKDRGVNIPIVFFTSVTDQTVRQILIGNGAYAVTTTFGELEGVIEELRKRGGGERGEEGEGVAEGEEVTEGEEGELHEEEVSQSASDWPQMIRGFVVDGTNEPLIGATVLVKNTSMGTVTDLDGQFSIQVPDADAILVFNYIGFETIEMGMPDKEVALRVVMEEEQEQSENISQQSKRQSKRSRKKPRSSATNTSYLKQQADFLGIDLTTQNFTSSEQRLVLCRDTLAALTNALSETNLTQIERDFLKDVVIKDIDQMIRILRNHPGEEKVLSPINDLRKAQESFRIMEEYFAREAGRDMERLFDFWERGRRDLEKAQESLESVL